MTVVETTTGTIYAYADEVATIRTKDTTASADCTDSTTTTGVDWSDYNPMHKVSFTGTGRCFVFTDNAGNKTAAHSSAKIAGVSSVTVADASVLDSSYTASAYNMVYTDDTTPTIRGTAPANARVKIYRPSTVRLPYGAADPSPAKLPVSNSVFDSYFYRGARAHLTAQQGVLQHLVYIEATTRDMYLCPAVAGTALNTPSSSDLHASSLCVNYGPFYFNSGPNDALEKHKVVSLTDAMIAAGGVLVYQAMSFEAEVAQWLPIYQDAPVEIGTATAGADGSFSVTLSTPLVAGEGALYTAFSTDGGTTYTEPVTEAVLSVDTGLSPTLIAQVQSATAAAASPDLVVVGEAGASIQFYTDSSCRNADGTPVQKKVIQGSEFAYAIKDIIAYPGTLPDGENTIYGKQTDLAGNVGPCQNLATVTTTGSGPDFTPTLADSTNSGATDDTVTKHTAVTIDTGAINEQGTIQSAGWWVTGATTQHSAGSPQALTVTNKATGVSFTTGALNDGVNTIHIKMTDQWGNHNTETIDITVDTTAPTITFVDEVAAAPV